MGAQQPVTMNIGGFAVVAPTARTRLSASHWARLSQAVLLEGEGRLDGANRLIAEVEERLGVNDAHRRALIHGVDAERYSIRLANATRERAELDRARVLNDPLEPPPIPSAVTSKLADARKAEAAAEALRKADPRKNRLEIKAHLTTAKLARRAAQLLQDEAAEKAWSQNAAKETAALALARGEEIEQEITEVFDWLRDEDGALVRDHSSQTAILQTQRAAVLRPTTHDGLLHALCNGDLDDDKERLVSAVRLYQVGERYRAAFEVAEGLRTGDKQEIRAPSSAPGGLQEKGVEARDTLAVMRNGLPVRDVMGQRTSLHTHPMDWRTQKILDEVCGRKRTAAAAAKGLGMDHRTAKKRLRRGLFHVGENLDWW